MALETLSAMRGCTMPVIASGTIDTTPTVPDGFATMAE
jgi:hypothetical protein